MVLEIYPEMGLLAIVVVLFSFFSFFWSSKTIWLEFYRKFLPGKLRVSAPAWSSKKREDKQGCLSQADMEVSHVVAGSSMVAKGGVREKVREAVY